MKVKNVLLAMVFSVAVLGGYQVYEQVSVTSAESFLLANVEALATDEINPDCTHGCLVTKGYCWCYRPYPNEEAIWN